MFFFIYKNIFLLETLEYSNTFYAQPIQLMHDSCSGVSLIAIRSAIVC